MIAQGVSLYVIMHYLSAGQGLFTVPQASQCSRLGPPAKNLYFLPLASALYLTFKLIHKHLTIHIKPELPTQALYLTVCLTALFSSGLQMSVLRWQKGKKKLYFPSLLSLLHTSFLSAVGLLFDPGVRKCGCNCE